MDILHHPSQLAQFSLLLIHEWEHWLTSHLNEDRITLYLLFSEGLATFAEYVTSPDEVSNTARRKLLKVSREQFSLLEMESAIDADKNLPYAIGWFMWLLIYSYKAFGRTTQNYVDDTWLTSIVSGQNREKALAWLRTFSHISPKLFFKMYIEATRAMKVRLFFNRAAEEELLKL